MMQTVRSIFHIKFTCRSSGEEYVADGHHGFLDFSQKEHDVKFASLPEGKAFEDLQEVFFLKSQASKFNQPQNLTAGNEEEPLQNCLTLYVGGLSEQPAPTGHDLRHFFESAGCNVAGARVIMDTSKRGQKKGRSRGHGFVDFDDSDSFHVALKLDGEEAVGLAASGSNLQIEPEGLDEDRRKKKQKKRSRPAASSTTAI